VSLNGTSFLLISGLLTNRKTESNYRKWFEYLSAEGLNLSNKNIMTDLEFGLSNAGKRVWSTSKWKLCYFHVLLNNGEKMESLHIPNKIQKILEKEVEGIHLQKNEEEAVQQWKTFKDSLHFMNDHQTIVNPIQISISKWYFI